MVNLGFCKASFWGFLHLVHSSKVSYRLDMDMDMDMDICYFTGP
jgi:hypothetical protein